MKKYISRNNPEAGFTLVEMIVTMLVFSIIVLVTSNLYVQALNLQRRGFSAQNIQENALFILETMSKEARVSLISTADSGAKCKVNSKTLTMTHPTLGNIVYAFPGDGTLTKNGVVVNTSAVKFNSYSGFCIQATNSQPLVTIILSMVSNDPTAISINLQTSVSSREHSLNL